MPAAPKLTQLLWITGGALFVLAFMNTLGSSNPMTFKSSGAARAAMQEHMRRSEKSWAKSVKQRHDLIAQDWSVNPQDMPLFPCHDHDSYFSTPYSIWDFVPASYSCPHEMERIGRMGDGGKWVCGFSKYEEIPETKPCIIYSFGVQFESTYEDETLSRTNCEIWAYDYSVVDFGKQLTPENRPKAHFTQAGIGGKTDPTRSPPFFSIADLMAKNGHDYLDILKIDIEYSEFPSLSSLSEAFPASEGKSFPIGQMMIEIHLFSEGPLQNIDPQGLAAGTTKAMTSGVFLNWWEMLEERGMRPVWTEPNLLYTTLKMEGGGDPRLAEYTFVNVLDRRSVLFGGLTQADVGV